MTIPMRLLAPLVMIALSVGFCPRAAHAQDSVIIINDNGNVPAFPGPEQKGKSSEKDYEHETHIRYKSGNGIQKNGGEIFIEEKDSQAVCLEDVDGTKVLLPTDPWMLVTQSPTDNAVLSVGSKKNHLHIDLGATMQLRGSSDLDDPDPTQGKKNELSGLVLIQGSSVYLFDYTPGASPGFIIHYCGPKGGCQDDKNNDQCKGAVSPDNYRSGAAKAIKPRTPAK